MTTAGGELHHCVVRVSTATGECRTCGSLPSGTGMTRYAMRFSEIALSSAYLSLHAQAAEAHEQAAARWRRARRDSGGSAEMYARQDTKIHFHEVAAALHRGFEP